MERTVFGNAERFEIEVRLSGDREPRSRLPAHGGWSTGEMRLTVGGHVLTHHSHAGDAQDAVRWYLLPIFEWLAQNWIALFHEENYSWNENSAGPAASATFLALRRFIAANDDAGRAEYAKIRAWWMRHALRAADSSALYPDIYFRRLGEDIEVSWTARQPVHAPDGFRFALTPGVATLPVAQVVKPLWQALKWFVEAPATLDGADRAAVYELRQRVETLATVSTRELESSYLSPRLLDLVYAAKAKFGIDSESVRLTAIPALEFLDSPVLMFGGVKPDIGAADVDVLIEFLRAHHGREESDGLAKLVDAHIGTPIAAPFEEGYELAEDLLDELGLPAHASFVDIRMVLDGLDVAIEERELQTQSIRGVAVAGEHYSPAILVNTTNVFNKTEYGKRFTLAHELFHILYDRTRAKRVTHTSGPWAPAGVEKRANAFAAMLLMPRELVRRAVRRIDLEAVAQAAESLRVGLSALVEHMYNLNMIDEMDRGYLRDAMGSALLGK